MTNITLIVGLGNPGAKYHATRHNAGSWFVEQLAAQHQVVLRSEPKFHGVFGMIPEVNGRLLIPSTFMNLSGQSVAAIAAFYKIPAAEILVAHDELDFEPGTTKLKWSGGHGGHNGLRDIIEHLNTPDFWRLRIGIGHPKIREEVADYVLHAPSKEEENKINETLKNVLKIVPSLFKGEFQLAMNNLHGVTPHGI